MANYICKKQEITKVAVIWFNEINGCKYIMAGKNFPLKFGKQSSCENYKLVNFVMNFPAGKQDNNESLKKSAIRELSEETGGFFYCDEIAVPWHLEEYSSENLKPIKISFDDVVQINFDPVPISMFNPWQKKDMYFDFFFFKLETKNISLDLLNKFCEAAIQKLPDKQFKHYKEVFGYELIDIKAFVSGLMFLGNVSVDKYWFLSNNSKKSKIDRQFLFKTKSGYFFFNKRYFLALSKIVTLFKRFVGIE